MKTLVFGCKGQLGQSLASTVPLKTELIGLDSTDADITDATAVLDACRRINPDVIVNAAAYTAVDNAESEPELAASVNVDGSRNVAVASNDVGAKLIHVSTDFVFDGQSMTPYKTDAETNPLNVYGATKRDGELAVLQNSNNSIVIRTSWLYSQYGHNFVKTMLRLMREREELSIVADQVGSPTWADSLAGVVWVFAGKPEQRGVFHWSDGGEISWHEFAVAIQEEALSIGLLAKKIPIHAITSEDYPTAATRPRYSVLDCSKTLATIDLSPRHWRTNLQEMLNRLASRPNK